MPVAVGAVHGDVGDAVGVLASVNVTKGVGARPAFLQVGCEERSCQGGLGVAEEGDLLGWADWDW